MSFTLACVEKKYTSMFFIGWNVVYVYFICVICLHCIGGHDAVMDYQHLRWELQEFAVEVNKILLHVV